MRESSAVAAVDSAGHEPFQVLTAKALKADHAAFGALPGGGKGCVEFRQPGILEQTAHVSMGLTASRVPLAVAGSRLQCRQSGRVLPCVEVQACLSQPKGAIGWVGRLREVNGLASGFSGRLVKSVRLTPDGRVPQTSLNTIPIMKEPLWSAPRLFM